VPDPFVPPHCPWPECGEHRRTEPGYRFTHAGHYVTLRERVPRCRCKSCGRTYSRSAFTTSYYLKRPELLQPIAKGLVAGSAHRQLARSLGCSPSTVTRQSARLGRHGILFLSEALARLAGTVAEPIVADHYESFEFTQDLPFGVLTLVGRDSWFVYGLDPVPHRWGGRLSPMQRARLKRRPARPARGGYRGSFARGLDGILELAAPGAVIPLACDGMIAYRRAVHTHPQRERIALDCRPNPVRGPKGSPRSPEARWRDAAMYPVDQLHRLIAHTLASEKSETISFGRRLNAIMERLVLMAVWRNFVKGRSERQPDRSTPAMHAGLTRRPWLWAEVLARRRFPGRERVPPVWRELYRRAWTTPVLRSNARHDLVHAW
jgi:transposase-like protein